MTPTLMLNTPVGKQPPAPVHIEGKGFNSSLSAHHRHTLSSSAMFLLRPLSDHLLLSPTQHTVLPTSVDSG